MDIKKELQDLCDRYKAEAEKILEKAKAEKKVWKPEEGDFYWYIGSPGSTGTYVWEEDDDYCKSNYAIGNCFPTKEAAEFAVEKLKVIAELKRFAEEHNEEIDWYDCYYQKWHIYYDYSVYLIGVSPCYSAKTNAIYFSSEEIAKAAIEAIGEERLKKYYFEVEACR